mgnify:CR=1 FL=1
MLIVAFWIALVLALLTTVSAIVKAQSDEIFQHDILFTHRLPVFGGQRGEIAVIEYRNSGFGVGAEYRISPHITSFIEFRHYRYLKEHYADFEAAHLDYAQKEFRLGVNYRY